MNLKCYKTIALKQNTSTIQMKSLSKPQSFNHNTINAIQQYKIKEITVQEPAVI